MASTPVKPPYNLRPRKPISYRESDDEADAEADELLATNSPKALNTVSI